MILKENEVLRCPRCGGKTFCATAHVTQDWELDDSGTFVRCLNDCIEVTHEPDKEDVWDCKTCAASAIPSIACSILTGSAKRRSSPAGLRA